MDKDTEKIYLLIGTNIKEFRKQQGISAEKLAELANLSSVYISYIENGKRKPSLTSLIKICNALEVTFEELICGKRCHNHAEYMTESDLLMSDCSEKEKRIINMIISAVKDSLRNNNWIL